MAKKDFLPRQDSIFDEWEGNFDAKLAVHSATLGLDPALVADVATTIALHRAAYSTALAKQAEAKAANEAKDALKLIIIAKVRDAAQKCKASSAYNEAIGEELGIVGSEQTLDLNNAKPEVTRISYQNDQIVFDWIRAHLHGVIVYGAIRNASNMQNELNPANSSSINPGADDAAGLMIHANLQWEEIGRDFRSPYEDKRRNLTQQPETRYYKFRYLYKDQIVGVDSDIIKVIAEIY